MTGHWTPLPGITDLLVEPERGKRQLPGHDKKFDAVDADWDAARDSINSMIDNINSVLSDAGVHHHDLPRLTDKSLEELIVLPLSGDYYAIGTNANACTHMKKAMDQWARGFSTISGDTRAAFGGEAALAFDATLIAFRLVAEAVARVFGAGTGVFNDVARFSEHIAIRVAKIERVVAEKLFKLLTKLGSKFTSFVGWTEFVYEIARKGFDAVTDIWHDIKDLVDAIAEAFALVKNVKAWAETAAARLKTFRQIVNLMRQLPRLGPDQALKDLHISPSFDKIIAEYEKEFPAEDTGSENSVDDAMSKQDGDVDPWFARNGKWPWFDPTPWDAHNGDGYDVPKPGDPDFHPGVTALPPPDDRTP